MKIKRFTARNMREAMRMVREEQGPDAVILSNRRVPEGIEVLAATDYDASLMQQTLRQTAQTQVLTTPATQAATLAPAAPVKPAPLAARNAELAPPRFNRTDPTPVVEADAAPNFQNFLEERFESLRERAPRLTAAPAAVAEKPAAKTGVLEKFMSLSLAPKLGSDAAAPINSTPLARETPKLPVLTALTAPVAAPVVTTATAAVTPTISAPAAAIVAAAAQPISEPIAAPATAAPTTPAPADDTRYQELKNEVSSMRQLMQNQLSGLVWDHLQVKQPKRVEVMRSLINLSIAPSLAREIIAEMPESEAAKHNGHPPIGLVARRIPTTSEDVVLEGGVIALIGATGVGKTTTLAKLAAHYVAKHGTKDIALITTDTFRIAAQEQLHTYGRLLGVPVHTAANGEQLAQILKSLGDRRLVLIDTAGLSPRDARVNAQLDMLGKSGKIKRLLVLPASSQAGDLDEAVRRFGAAPLYGCILTKLDEATRIGGALSTVIRRKLPVAYFCDGQRVPEDLHMARAYPLAARAQQLAQQTVAQLDDEALSLQFGASHAAA